MGARGTVLKRRQMRKQVKMLKDHAHLAPNDINVLEVMGQFYSINDDFSLLVFLQPVDASDQR